MLKSRNSQKKILNVLWLILVVLAIIVFLFITKTKFSWIYPIRTQKQYIANIEKLLNIGDFSLAYKEALNYEKKFPKASDSVYYLGETLFQMGEYRASINSFQLALRDNQLDSQKKSNIYYLIGRGYDYLNDSASAISHFQTAINIYPSNSLAYDALAIQYIKATKYVNAIAALNQELSLIPDPTNNPLATSAYYYLAKIYFKTANYAEAQAKIGIAEKLSNGLTQPKPVSLIQEICELKSEIAKMNK